MTADTPLTVGAGAAEIVIGVPVELAGYARRDGPAHAAHDSLRVRTTVIRTDIAAVALVVLDLLYVPSVVAVAVRQITAVTLGIDPHNVLVAATHTHAGPADLVTSTALRTSICAAARRAAELAVASAEPARLALGVREVAGISANRRHHNGSIDRYARILVAKPVLDPTRTLAVIINFPCHATVLDHEWNQVSADFPGVVCALVERTVGGTATYLQGFAGDVNPARSGPGWSECRRIGGVLGSTAIAVALQAQGLFAGLLAESPTHQTLFDVTEQSGCRELSPRLAAAWATVPADRTTRPSHQVHGARPTAAAAESEAWIAELLAAHPDLFGAFDPGPPDRIEVQVLTLADDLRIVGIPGEPFGATAAALRSTAGGDLLAAGYANASIGYLPPRDEWTTGGYEIGCCRYAPETETAVREAALGLIGTS